MNFRIRGLSPEPFIGLYGLADEELAARGARRYIADACPGFPDRIEVRDVDKGEAVLLVNTLPGKSRHLCTGRRGERLRCRQ